MEQAGNVIPGLITGEATRRNRRVEDNIHSLLYAHTQTAESARQIREHVVRAENLLQLSAAPVPDSRVRDALTEPVFDKSA